MRAVGTLVVALVLLLLLSGTVHGATSYANPVLHAPAHWYPQPGGVLCEVEVRGGVSPYYGPATPFSVHSADATTLCSEFTSGTLASFAGTSWTIASTPAPRAVLDTGGSRHRAILTSFGGMKTSTGQVPVLTLDTVDVQEYPGGRPTLAEGSICSDEIFLPFSKYTSAPSPDSNFYFKIATNDGPWERCASAFPDNTLMQGWRSESRNPPTYEFPIYCDDVQIQIGPLFENGDWQNLQGTYRISDERGKCDCGTFNCPTDCDDLLYTIRRTKNVGSFWSGDQIIGFVFSALWNPSTGKLQRYTLATSDADKAAGGFSFKVECIGGKTPAQVCDVYGGDFGPAEAYDNSKCCNADSLGETVFVGQDEFSCAQAGLRYEWQEVVIEGCGTNGKRFTTDPAGYCCESGTPYNDAPHLYNTDTNTFLQTPQRSFWCANNALTSSTHNDPWAHNGTQWIRCDATTSPVVQRSFLCSQPDASWERCVCNTNSRTGCGASEHVTGYYCADSNTWTTNRNAAWACTESQRMIDESTCCHPGQYTVIQKDSTYYDTENNPQIYKVTEACFDGIIVNEYTIASSQPAAIPTIPNTLRRT